MLLLFLTVASIVLVSAQDDDFRTRLIGFDSCDPTEVDVIQAAWEDSWQVMDTIREINMNWDEAAAVDFLEPPGYNREQRAVIQDILRNLGTITGHGIPFPPLDWQIHVRCDDLKNWCPTAAYTTNRGENGITTINFCPRFFTKPTLSAAMTNARRMRNPRQIFNLESYDRTTNFRIEFRDADSGRLKTRDVYGPERAKILARYRDDSDIGGIIVRSDENLEMYALAKFIQAQFRAYPHLPLVNTEPSKRRWDPLRRSLFLFNYTGGIVANSSAPDDDVTIVSNLPEDTSSVVIDKFYPDSDLLADYISAWKGWSLEEAGLTNLHINNFDTGFIRTVALSEPTGSKDIVVKKGDTVGVFDGSSDWADLVLLQPDLEELCY
ncbi:MAG: hypothetical protein M1840_003357 [Geoglossum simile]|nr:MAG: hypothetical protein M1840_003357 [Geoglossum simile]